jgi:cell division septation protein DedD
LTSYAQDDGFHEIQLNGKQLVFLFMAATVVSVVIFLCGVLVGRGVRAERGDLAQNTEVPIIDVVPAASQTALPGASTPEPVPTQPPTPVDELSYFNRLEKPTPAVETLKPAAEREAPSPGRRSPEAAPAASAAAKAPAPAVKAAAATPTEPPPGYAVQVAALNVRSEADAMARRLSTKGYSAYVVTPNTQTPSLFRVRIGTFKTRREAEAMAARLQKEEQFKPWVTR